MRPWIGTLLVWGLAFIMAEAIGVVVSSSMSSIVPQTEIVSLGQASTVIVRAAVIILLAPRTGVKLSSIYRSPAPARIVVLLVAAILTGVLAYLVNPTASSVIQYSNFEINGALWTVPFATAYYFSEIVLLNYLYVLAKNSWSLLGSHSVAAIVFLIIGWASLHAITQNLETAFFAVALVPIFYGTYEYTGRSPVTPILLWFVTLVF